MRDEPRPAAHLHLLEHWVVLNAGEEHPHGIRPVVEEGDASTIQVIGQLVDVRLQLCKSYGQTRNQGRCPLASRLPDHHSGPGLNPGSAAHWWGDLRKLLHLPIPQFP